MSRVDCLSKVPRNYCITFENEDELEKYVHLAMEEGDYSRSEVLDQFENFVWGLDERRACLNVVAWGQNHGEGPSETVSQTFARLADGREAVVGETLVDVPAGGEIFNSYREFVIPPWFASYCQLNAISDVRSGVLRVVDGTPHRGDPARLPGSRAAERPYAQPWQDPRSAVGAKARA